MDPISMFGYAVMGLAAIAGIVVAVVMNIKKRNNAEENGCGGGCGGGMMMTTNAPSHADVYNAAHGMVPAPTVPVHPNNVTYAENWTWGGAPCTFGAPAVVSMRPANNPMTPPMNHTMIYPSINRIDPIYPPCNDPIIPTNVNNYATPAMFTTPVMNNAYGYMPDQSAYGCNSAQFQPTYEPVHHMTMEECNQLHDVLNRCFAHVHSEVFVPRSDPSRVVETTCAYGNV